MIGTSTTASPPLLERITQLEALGRALEAVATTRNGRLVFVRGEAGVGKTALVRRFCDEQPATRVLWGACDALFTPRPLGPFVDIAQQTGGEVAELVEGSNRPHEVVAALGREVAGARRPSSCSRTCTGPTRRRSTRCGCSAAAPTASRRS